MINKIHHGDCLELSERIPSGSIDLILTDLPYGNMRGAELDGWGKDETNWDVAIEPKRIHEIANRVLRKNGKMVLFSQEPYTSRLIRESIANVPFSYRMIWEKDHFANALLSSKAPVSYYEDMLVFSKMHDTEGLHPLREYFKKIYEFIGLTKTAIIETIGQRADHTFRTNSTQFELCTEETYNEIIRVYDIGRMVGFTEYDELKRVDDQFKIGLSSTFNLWEGGKYKSNILRYKKDYDRFHPTQKPLLLLEDLIKTFSNKRDTVVDLTIGSGSTAMAALNTGRNFIGIEQEKKYVDIANKRIVERELQLV